MDICIIFEMIAPLLEMIMKKGKNMVTIFLHSKLLLIYNPILNCINGIVNYIIRKLSMV